MKRLLEAKAKIEVEDEKGYTNLSVAALFGKAGAVKLMLERGANIDAKDHL